MSLPTDQSQPAVRLYLFICFCLFLHSSSLYMNRSAVICVCTIILRYVHMHRYTYMYILFRLKLRVQKSVQTYTRPIKKVTCTQIVCWFTLFVLLVFFYCNTIDQTLICIQHTNTAKVTVLHTIHTIPVSSLCPSFCASLSGILVPDRFRVSGAHEICSCQIMALTINIIMSGITYIR